MAISIMKLEKPFAAILPNISGRRGTATKRIVFIGERKCVSIMNSDMQIPIAVASPAPKMPMSSVKTKK